MQPTLRGMLEIRLYSMMYRSPSLLLGPLVFEMKTGRVRAAAKVCGVWRGRETSVPEWATTRLYTDARLVASTSVTTPMRICITS